MPDLENFDVGAALAEAKKELREERLKNATIQLKNKLNEIEDTKVILRNLERELTELKHELAQGL